MSKLVYSPMTSLDGFIEDEAGRFDWAVPDDEVHTFINRLQTAIGTHLFGRRMYETMAVWETYGDEPGLSAAEAEYAEMWRGVDKVVYSRTLYGVWTQRTRLERSFDPEAVASMEDAAASDMSISGPSIAEQAFRAGLVDEIHLFVFPVVVGGGKPGLPRELRLNLELLDDRRFASGVVHLHHRVLYAEK